MRKERVTYKTIINENKVLNNVAAMTPLGEITATNCPKVVKYNGNAMQ